MTAGRDREITVDEAAAIFGASPRTVRRWCKAGKLLGRQVDRELAEIDENLIRNELTALERGEHLARRKAIYEALHPESARFSPQKQAARKSIQPSENISDGFAQDAAAKTGVTDRAVRYAVQIGEDITPEARDAIRETPTADNQADLLRLAKLPEDEQVAVAEEVRDTGKTVKQVELERKREAVDEQTRGQNVTAPTVQQDLAGVRNLTPVTEPTRTVTGSDGKQYPATRPRIDAVSEAPWSWHSTRRRARSCSFIAGRETR